VLVLVLSVELRMMLGARVVYHKDFAECGADPDEII